MAVGRTFREALGKAMQSLEQETYGFDWQPPDDSLAALSDQLSRPQPRRLWYIGEAIRRGISVEVIRERTSIDPWFLHQIRAIVDCEQLVARASRDVLTDELIRSAKRNGLADVRIGQLCGLAPAEVRERRLRAGIRPVYKRIDTCAAEFEAHAPYLYSTYEEEDEAGVSDRPKIVILGGGPNRIGQGIEFDYCCCHAVFALREAGYETIMVNCNPETVSTDYDTADRLYFEPLTFEDVLAIVERERPEGVIVQFGGQTPLKLAVPLERAGVRVLGTPPDAIDRAEDRERFDAVLETLSLRRPPGGVARSVEEARAVAARIGYPVLVRPSYVLGGRAMEIVRDPPALENYMRFAVRASPEHPVLVDRFLADATEVDVDAVCDGERVVIGGIMEHIEEAGVHSGDSACSLPPYSLAPEVVQEILASTRRLALELGVRGLMNVQYAVKQGQVFVLEVNPRASRTVPFVSKAIGRPLAKLAALVMVGKSLAELGFTEEIWPRHFSVKEAVFPFLKFPNVDTLLGPEMKSTGEVMGIDSDFGRAYAKSQIQAGNSLPRGGRVLVSIRPEDQEGVGESVALLARIGFKVVATRGTAEALAARGVAVEVVNKVREGSPHVLDRIEAGDVDLVINTVRPDPEAVADSFTIRRATLQRGIPYFTTAAAARAAAGGIRALQLASIGVRSLQEIHAAPEVRGET
jgi:carbamoyl-phosphate synthase large subunit